MDILTGENNPKLRQKSKPVTHLTKEVRSLVTEMKKTMEENEGVGLAAPQVGYPLRIIVCELEDKFYALINPEIINRSSQEIVMEEGCLSLPQVVGEVSRPEKVTIKALNLEGKKIKIKSFGLLARVLQHEIDHLDGILFIDKAKNITKNAQNKNIEI